MTDLNPYEKGLGIDLAKAQARIKKLEEKITKMADHVMIYSNDPHLVRWAGKILSKTKAKPINKKSPAITAGF